MDPLQVTAARTITPLDAAGDVDIEAFYDAHALEGWHRFRRGLRLAFLLLNSARSPFDFKHGSSPEIATTSTAA